MQAMPAPGGGASLPVGVEEENGVAFNQKEIVGSGQEVDRWEGHRSQSRRHLS